MKPFAAGRFFRTDPTIGFRDGELWPLARQSQIASASLRWILENDLVHTVIPAMNELRHVDDAVAACESPLTSGDRELLDEIAAKLPTY
jgi:aryl-alcohol dehydrogenase-like predicted oxidoreductase